MKLTTKNSYCTWRKSRKRLAGPIIQPRLSQCIALPQSGKVAIHCGQQQRRGLPRSRFLDRSDTLILKRGALRVPRFLFRYAITPPDVRKANEGFLARSAGE